MKKRESNSSAPPTKAARRKYDDEFKQQAVTMIRNGQSTRSVAEALGISENLLHQWKRAIRSNQSAAESEVEQLRQRLKQVEMERDILKKALSIFSRQT
jgi:transposase